MSSKVTGRKNAQGRSCKALVGNIAGISAGVFSTVFVVHTGIADATRFAMPPDSGLLVLAGFLTFACTSLLAIAGYRLGAAVHGCVRPDSLSVRGGGLDLSNGRLVWAIVLRTLGMALGVLPGLAAGLTTYGPLASEKADHSGRAHIGSQFAAVGQRLTGTLPLVAANAIQTGRPNDRAANRGQGIRRGTF